MTDTPPPAEPLGPGSPPGAQQPGGSAGSSGSAAPTAPDPEDPPTPDPQPTEPTTPTGAAGPSAPTGSGEPTSSAGPTGPAGGHRPPPPPGPGAPWGSGPGGSSAVAPPAGRWGLVRPRQNRYVAGVCAAIGDATGTDPVLWRVLVAGLTVFGGVGLLLYAAAWLLTPAEGDTASPAEAALGRGRSTTSPALAILLGVLVVTMTLVATSQGVRPVVLAIALVGGVAVLMSRGGAGGNRQPGSGPGAAGPYPVAPFPPGPPAAPPATAAGTTWLLPPVPPAPGAAGPGVAPAAPVPPGPGMAPPPYGPVPPGGFRPPYAPHGPYAPSRPYPPAPVPPPAAVRPPAPPRPRSPLGRIVGYLVLVALGFVAAADLAGTNVPGRAYLAVALGVVGVGLVVGAWFGRARRLIPAGLVLTLLLGAATAARDVDNQPRRFEDVLWTPTSVTEMPPEYRVHLGNAMLDLSRVDFTDRTVDLRASVDAGQLRIVLPPDVDVVVNAHVNAGNAQVLGTAWNGVDVPRRTIRDNGDDGPGGGTLNLTGEVNLGSLEVVR